MQSCVASASGEVHINHAHQRRHRLRVIRQRFGQTSQTGFARAHAGADHPRGENQQAGRGHFVQIVLFQPTQRLAELDHLGRQRRIHLGLVGDDALLLGRGG